MCHFTMWIYIFVYFYCVLPVGRAEIVLGKETEEFDFDGLPGAQHEFKVEVPAGREDCFYQKVVRGGKMHISFEVLDGGDYTISAFLKDQFYPEDFIDAIYFQPDGEFEHEAHFGGKSSMVLKGGDTNIQLLLYKPNYELLLDSGQTAHAGFEPEITETGPYAICLDNTFSRMASKLVYVYIVTFVESEWEEYQKELEDVSLTVHNFTDSIHQVEKSLNEALVHQAQSRMHVIKDWYLIIGNNNYIQRWSLAQCCVIVISTCVQVYFVRRLFRYTNVTPTSKPRA